MEAAAYMGQIRIVLRAVAATGTANPGHILHTANELLLAMDNPSSRPAVSCGSTR